MGEKKLPKVVKTRETEHAQLSPDHAGQCHLSYTGRYMVAIEVPEHIHPLIGVEGGAMVGAADRRVTVLGYVNSSGMVEISDLNGNSWWEDPNALTPVPKTQTVTLSVEVPVDVDPDTLRVTRWFDPDTLWVTRWDDALKPLPRRIVAIDGEEVDHG